MTMAEMERRIESLEKRVRELEARPREVHNHYPPSLTWTPPRVNPYDPFGPGTIIC